MAVAVGSACTLCREPSECVLTATAPHRYVTVALCPFHASQVAKAHQGSPWLEVKPPMQPVDVKEDPE